MENLPKWYELFWEDIPIGQENAISYEYLMAEWCCSDREVRRILHDLSSYDNGDGYILIRSSRIKGFYRTKDPCDIRMYEKECLNRIRHTFAPFKKIKRVLGEELQEGLFDEV